MALDHGIGVRIPASQPNRINRLALSSSGTWQHTGQSCASTGSISGTVSFAGGVAVNLTGDGPSPSTLLSGDPTYSGFVSTAGPLTALRVVVFRCTSGSVSLDLTQTATFTMNRR